MRRAVCPLALLVAALPAAGCAAPGQRTDDPAAALPGAMAALDLRPTGSAEVYRGSALMAFLGDRAQTHLSYNEESAARRTYRYGAPVAETVSIEVHLMRTALDATGLLRYAHRADPPAAIGREGRRSHNGLAFVRGRAYVRAATMRAAGDFETGRLKELVDRIDADLPRDRTGLAFLDRLPAEAVRGTVQFARTNAILDTLAPLPEGAVGFDRATTLGLAADRADGAGRLVLMQFETPAQAAAAADTARAVIGRAWSRWTVGQAGRVMLVFARTDGLVTNNDIAATQALAERIAGGE